MVAIWLETDQSLVNSDSVLWGPRRSSSSPQRSQRATGEKHLRGKHLLTLTGLCGGMNPGEGPRADVTAPVHLWMDRPLRRRAPRPRVGCTARTPGSGAAFPPYARASEE